MVEVPGGVVDGFVRLGQLDHLPKGTAHVQQGGVGKRHVSVTDRGSHEPCQSRAVAATDRVV